MAQLELRRSIKQKNQLLEQKEMLLKEVNHRTKNNLQLIVGLIQLQLRRVDDPEARTVLLDTSRRIMSIAAVHERLYQADEMGSVDAELYLSQVIEGIQATANQEVIFQLDLESVSLHLDKAIPLALLVNELLTNAMKYAYMPSSPGCVDITFHQENHQFVLSVADQGRGFPLGFDVHKSKSLGMKIIASLCRQLDAELAFFDARPGVRCEVRFSGAIHPQD